MLVQRSTSLWLRGGHAGQSFIRLLRQQRRFEVLAKATLNRDSLPQPTSFGFRGTTGEQDRPDVPTKTTSNHRNHRVSTLVLL
ncbi:hypothetical protein VNO77_14822 [Canavalia gladiata]|uniref:Uncharacterized protein n=1 Tax=Canavalia gladiata TaxID=3824 RepID=A0AAN9M398_CANGL